jgi:hypothetical protein
MKIAIEGGKREVEELGDVENMGGRLPTILPRFGSSSVEETPTFAMMEL